jgi:hypothetical protein
MSCHRKGKSHVHARGISFHRGIEELLDLSKRNDLIELLFYFNLSHAKDAVKHASGQASLLAVKLAGKRSIPLLLLMADDILFGEIINFDDGITHCLTLLVNSPGRPRRMNSESFLSINCKDLC